MRLITHSRTSGPVASRGACRAATATRGRAGHRKRWPRDTCGVGDRERPARARPPGTGRDRDAWARGPPQALGARPSLPGAAAIRSGSRVS